MHNFKKLRSEGFTIVELVVVIILLGILAATALPRFIDVDDRAHNAAFEGILGAYQTGIALYHAQWVADGQGSAGTQIAAFDNLRVTPTGYPYSQSSQTGNVPTVSQDCEDVFVGVLQGGPSVEDAAALANVGASTSDFAAVRSGANCEYYYTAENTGSGEQVRTFTYASDTGLVTQGLVTLP